MTNARKISRDEQECNSLWGQCIHVRDKWCFCGRQDKQAHHIFLRSQGNWETTYDIDFGTLLCTEHHGGATERPYGEIFDKIVNNIRQHNDQIRWGHVQEWGRADKILEYHNSVKKPCPIPANFGHLKKMLNWKLIQLKDQAWTETDIEPGYGDAR